MIKRNDAPTYVWDILESIRRKNIHQSSMGMYSCEETMATTTSVCWDIKRACLRSWSICLQHLHKEIVISKFHTAVYFGFLEMKHYLLQMEPKEMEIGLAVGGAFLSSALNVLFDRLAPQGDLLKMFQKHKHHVRLLRKLKMTLLAFQAVLSDAENKQASNPHVSQWIDELRDAVDGAENLMEVKSTMRLEA
ncbi:hypothetical protein HAX54_043238 [Datura stramonium]|uniref:Disease resistance N-terminal domain-containing protein n=1 Tax=Datura stramonium TaxID=4076 RepID=A0ABS8SNF5_DATST|nr:hypothetical protein [Datura stramonium]